MDIRQPTVISLDSLILPIHPESWRDDILPTIQDMLDIHEDGLQGNYQIKLSEAFRDYKNHSKPINGTSFTNDPRELLTHILELSAVWPNAIYAFDAVKEYKNVEAAILDTALIRDVEVVDYMKGLSGYGPSIFSMSEKPTHIIVYDGISEDINDYSSLLLNINIFNPISTPFVPSSCPLPATEQDFQQVEETLMPYLEKNGFVKLPDENHFYNRIHFTPKTDFWFLESRIEQYNEQEILDFVTGLRSILQQSDIGVNLELNSFIREGKYMVKPRNGIGPAMYYLDAYSGSRTEPELRDNFGLHERFIAPISL